MSDDTTPAVAAPSESASSRLPLMILVMMATTVQALDSTVANVALPHMQGAMSAAQDQITWVVTSYVVAAAITIPLTGFLEKRFTRRRLFIASMIGFTIASMLCGAAQSLAQIVFFRLLQGVAGAFIIPLSQAVLMDAYPKEKHGVALSIWSIGTLVAPILGPTIGGWLTESFSWRWVFYVNLPVGGLAAAGMAIFLPRDRGDRDVHFDVAGFALLGMSIGALQMALDRGTSLDWFASNEIIVEFAISAFAFYFFLVRMFTTPQPFVNMALFKDTHFVIGVVLGAAYFLTMMSTMALTPAMLQSLLGYPVLTSGLLLMPRGLGSFFSMMAVGRLLRIAEPRVLIMAGSVIAAIGFWQMSAFNLEVSQHDIIVSGFVQGIGMGLVFPPLITLTFETLPARIRTEAASIGSLIRNLGGAVGVSFAATMLARYSQINHAELTLHVTPYNRALHFAASQYTSQNLQQAVILEGEISRQASMIAYIDIFQFMTYVLLGAAVLVMVVRPSENRPATPEAALPEM